MESLTVAVQLIICIHACIDGVHVLCVLFPRCMARRIGEERADAAADMYVSLFDVGWSHHYHCCQPYPTTSSSLAETTPITIPTITQQQHEAHALLRRVLAYWVAAMSLTRLTAAVHPESSGALGTAALMYLLEALSFEFESTVVGTVPHRAARIVSVVSMTLCVLTLFLALRSV